VLWGLHLELVHSSSNAVFEAGYVKVDQQSRPTVAQSQVRQQLSLVNRMGLLDGFDLDHNALVDEKIDSVAVFQLHSFVDQRNGNFGANGQASPAKLVRETPRR
jgi:hypothetical protein